MASSKRFLVIMVLSLTPCIWLAGCGKAKHVPDATHRNGDSKAQGESGHEQAIPEGSMAGMDHGGERAKEAGVATSGGYTLDVLTSPESAQPNSGTSLTFLIRDQQGELVKELAVVHTKPVHLIAVRKDLTGFQHVHPVFDSGSGTISMTGLQFPAAGEYRLFVDLTPAGAKNVVLTHDVTVGKPADYQPEPVAADSSFAKTFDGTRVSLTTTPATLRAGRESTLTFTLTDERSDKPVSDLEPYLGAPGHSVILQAGTLDFLHAHPEDMAGMTGEHAGHKMETSNPGPNVTFKTTFDRPGIYRAFTQFKRNGGLITTTFTLGVD